MNWLEIDKGIVIGVHGHKCNSPNKWVQCSNEDAAIVDPGDEFKDGKVVKQKDNTSDQATGNTKHTRKQLAERHIQKHYSLQEQIRILRGSDHNQKQKLDDFLRQIDDWLKNTKAELKALRDIRRSK